MQPTLQIETEEMFQNKNFIDGESVTEREGGGARGGDRQRKRKRDRDGDIQRERERNRERETEKYREK